MRVAALILTGALACGTPRPSTRAAQRPDSIARQAATLPAPPVQAPAVLAGTWALRAENRAAGPHLELSIDSISGATFRVRLAFLMQGDVGIDPRRFEPTRGDIGADGRVHLTVKARDRAEPFGEMAGTLAGDTIRLRIYRWAGEDQTAGGTSWILIKQP
jgi:hypothetical protein